MSDKGWETENVRAVTGLAVVTVGILAVVALAALAVVLLGSGSKDSVVAVTTSALGIISAVVSGYLGIKASANSKSDAAKATSEKADEAAVATYEARIKESKVDRLNQEIDDREKKGEIDEKLADELRNASAQAEEEARRSDPPGGG
jgi:basic membrane lipoprotein Med (substrate-binding protein (PBP1-ABC) superfamily)